MQLLGLDRDIRAGVPNVPGGPIIEIARLSPSFRPLVGISLITRMPNLYNAVPNPPFFTSFKENMPLRDLPPVIDTVPGASAIQNLIDNTEWAQQAANPAAYAPHIKRPVIIQFARGDETVPNPTTSAILRAGNLASRATLFRNDLANAAFGTSKNPHTFLTKSSGRVRRSRSQRRPRSRRSSPATVRRRSTRTEPGRSSRHRRRWFRRTSRTFRSEPGEPRACGAPP